jgi:hypothetical protein
MLQDFAEKLSDKNHPEPDDFIQAIRKLTADQLQVLCESIRNCGRSYFGPMNGTELIAFLREVYRA